MIVPFPRRSPVGCDFGRGGIKLVQLARMRKSWKVLRCDLREMVPESTLGSAWPNREALQAAAACDWAHEKPFVVALQHEPELVQHLSMPEMPARDLREALRWEAKRALPQDGDAFVVDYISAQTVTTDQGRVIPVTLVAAERRFVEEEYAKYRETGLRVKSMNIKPMAFYYAAKRLGLDQTGTGFSAFVDIGTAGTDIGVVKHGMLRFSRSVALGGDGLTKALMRARRLDYRQAEDLKRKHGLSGDPQIRDVLLPEVDRIVVEIQRSIDYYRAQSRDSTFETLWIGGGTVLTPGLLEHLAKFVDAKVRMLNPFEDMELGAATPNNEAEAPRFVAAVGLALAGRV